METPSGSCAYADPPSKKVPVLKPDIVRRGPPANPPPPIETTDDAEDDHGAARTFESFRVPSFSLPALTVLLRRDIVHSLTHLMHGKTHGHG